MPQLSELQDWLRWIFTEPGGVDKALNSPANQPAGLKRRAEPLPRRLSSIEDRPPVDAARRLAVYSDAYFLRLLESLGSDFKAVRRALGEELFRRLIAQYLAVTPSTSKNISDLGGSLPGFIARGELGRKFPFLADLAALEWTVLRCLFTDRLPDLDAKSLEEIAAAAWPNAKLIADPAVALLELEWPVQELWRRRDKPFGAGMRRLKRPLPTRLLVYRDEQWVKIRALGALEHRTLELIGQGRTLAGICLELGEGAGSQTAAADIQSWFSDWAACGVVKRVELPELAASA